MRTITQADIEQLRSPAGGFNEATMQLFGCWPLFEGWQQRLIGRQVSNKTWKEAQKAKAVVSHRFRGNTRSARR